MTNEHPARRGVSHTFANPDGTEARVLGLWSPAGAGLDYMAAIGAAMPADGTRPDGAVMAALFEAHDTRMLP